MFWRQSKQSGSANQPGAVRLVTSNSVAQPRRTLQPSNRCHAQPEQPHPMPPQDLVEVGKRCKNAWARGSQPSESTPNTDCMIWGPFDTRDPGADGPNQRKRRGHDGVGLGSQPISQYSNYAYMYICICIHICRTCTYTCAYTYIYIYMYIHVYTYKLDIHLYIYILHIPTCRYI